MILVLKNSILNIFMENGNMLFQLPTLPFAYDAFEPYIDAQTMEIHHTKHHQTYIDQLNNVIRNNPDLEQLSLEALLRSYQSYDQKTGLIIKNHGGGHFNHTFSGHRCILKDCANR